MALATIDPDNIFWREIVVGGKNLARNLQKKLERKEHAARCLIADIARHQCELDPGHPAYRDYLVELCQAQKTQATQELIAALAEIQFLTGTLQSINPR